ncbi:MAG: carboxypeptidase-like regulatory domain-containing protein, partial [Chitinophagaceae bacterium]|nr:carboxypeptidase-like regulatory domain-containing protein [Chitinophagaceae bacterium]
MLKKLTALFICLVTIIYGVHAQQYAYINGKVTNERGKAMDAVTVALSGTAIGTSTDRKGDYKLEIPANSRVTLVFSHLGYEVQSQSLVMIPGQSKTINIQLAPSATQMKDFVKTAERRDEAGNIKLDVSKAGLLPSTSFGSGVEALIKTYVGSNNELTSQYNVRGGNYDENLVYVNDFEIYRPFLTRSGQQEGMSFVNADLVSGVNFSIGGFQSKYGDKMSSVLDVNYKNPTKFGGRAVASMLGASLALEGASKNNKLTWLFGARQKSNQYLLKAQPTKGIYNPSFTDIQADIKYHFNAKWEVELIGNYARNRFRYIPKESTSSFGLINKAYQLRVFYNGSETDQFDSRFGGIS